MDEHVLDGRNGDVFDSVSGEDVGEFLSFFLNERVIRHKQTEFARVLGGNGFPDVGDGSGRLTGSGLGDKNRCRMVRARRPVAQLAAERSGSSWDMLQGSRGDLDNFKFGWAFDRSGSTFR